MKLSHRVGQARILIPMIIMILVASCGQKGELYLPDDQQSALPHVHVKT